MSTAINIIKACPLFYEFLDDEIERIVSKCQVIGFEKNSAVFEDGDRGNELYIILSGECHVKKGNTTLAILKKGELFGEMVLINENIRSAKIEAASKIDLLVISYDDIFNFYKSDPKIFGIFILNLCRLLSKRLKGAGREIRRLNAFIEERKLSA